jgi:hypothetical protein
MEAEPQVGTTRPWSVGSLLQFKGPQAGSREPGCVSFYDLSIFFNFNFFSIMRVCMWIIVKSFGYVIEEPINQEAARKV